MGPLLAKVFPHAKRRPVLRPGRVEDHPHEEAPRGGRVLIDVDDVQPGVGEEPRDRGDQPRPIRAGEQQSRGFGLRSDQGIMSYFGLSTRCRAKIRNEQVSCVTAATLIPSL